MPAQIDKLIINGPYEEPSRHWKYEREKREFECVDGRRPAGYYRASPNASSFDDPGVFEPIPLVKDIRERVDKWRKDGYAGITSITRRLLEHWRDPEVRKNRFFFCQLEAIETLIWLTEAPDAERVGIEIPGDGGPFERWCSKMATGTGKTVVMAMTLAWQFINKATYPSDKKFSRNALVMAPGLTVKDRLQVLHPSRAGNYYEKFSIVPPGLHDKLRRGKVVVRNWHALSWESQEVLDKKFEKGRLRVVDKRKRMAKSGAVFVKDVIGDLGNAKDIIVINDEAHHAWRSNPQAAGKHKRATTGRDSTEEGTVWIAGLDKIHEQRGILRCFDMSATPFRSSGEAAKEGALFEWIVSDFGLSDAVESGLVKTPRVPVRDDSFKVDKEMRSRLYHIYMDESVKGDISRKAEKEEPLPDLITNAYDLLGADWSKLKEEWEADGSKVPPVMITIANLTHTSARIKYAFDDKQIAVEELQDPEKNLLVDSKVLKEAEKQAVSKALDENATEGKAKLTQDQKTELLRRKVNTIGKEGEPGEQIHNVIAVGMLSEGWDAHTVTHIMGLRAFSSQLLCEQVVGRGLRRRDYEVNGDGMLEPEYVNIFGVPFTFLPHESDTSGGKRPKPPKTAIMPVKEKAQHEISWPNVLRIESAYKAEMTLDVNAMKTLVLDPYEFITAAELTDIVDGKPHAIITKSINLDKIEKHLRLQTIAFRIAASIYKLDRNTERLEQWKNDEMSFVAQIVKFVKQVLNSNKIVLLNNLFDQPGDDRKRTVVFMLHMTKIINHILDAIESQGTDKLVPIFDTERPHLSTATSPTWHTAKPCVNAAKSHINFCVYDSRWEAEESYHLDSSDLVESFVKNDLRGLVVYYREKGGIRKYYPDFIIKLTNGEFLVLEVKGQERGSENLKHDSMEKWVQAINEHGGHGRWHFEISRQPSDIQGILQKLTN